MNETNMREITQIEFKIKIDKEEKIVVFIRPEKIKDLLEDKETLLSDFIKDI